MKNKIAIVLNNNNSIQKNLHVQNVVRYICNKMNKNI